MSYTNFHILRSSEGVYRRVISLYSYRILSCIIHLTCKCCIVCSIIVWPKPLDCITSNLIKWKRKSEFYFIWCRSSECKWVWNNVFKNISSYFIVRSSFYRRSNCHTSWSCDSRVCSEWSSLIYWSLYQICRSECWNAPVECKWEYCWESSDDFIRIICWSCCPIRYCKIFLIRSGDGEIRIYFRSGKTRES